MANVCNMCGRHLFRGFRMSSISEKLTLHPPKRDLSYFLIHPKLKILAVKQKPTLGGGVQQIMPFSSSVSEEETEKFSKLAPSWWDTRGEMMALHTMNNLRVPFIRDCLLYEGHGKPNCPKPLEGVELLDVGCGAGILSEPLARLGATVVGIDSSTDALEVARTHRGDDKDLENLQYLDSWLEDLVAVGSIKFDAVVASEVIEHVNDYRNFIGLCNKVLKPGGSLFISTMNRTYLSYALGIVAAEYVLNVVAPGTHNWDKFLSPDEIESALLEENCPLRKLHGMCYDPFRNKWSWTSNTELNYIVHAVKSDPTTASGEDLNTAGSEEDIDTNTQV